MTMRCQHLCPEFNFVSIDNKFTNFDDTLPHFTFGDAFFLQYYYVTQNNNGLNSFLLRTRFRFKR